MRKSSLLNVLCASFFLFNICISQAQAVTIFEAFNSISGEGEFTVDNNTGSSDIFAFAVRNDTLNYVPDNQGEGNLGVGLGEWTGYLLSSDQWGLGIFADMPSGLGISAPTPGSFTDIFGPVTGPPEDALVAFYLFTGDTDPSPPDIVLINAGETQDGFFFGAEVPESPFIAYGVDDSGGGDPTVTTSQGETMPAIPIPAAVWLFGSGLLGLIGIARRKKAA